MTIPTVTQPSELAKRIAEDVNAHLDGDTKDDFVEMDSLVIALHIAPLEAENEARAKLEKDLTAEIDNLTQQVADHEACAADVRRLTRELDVVLSGEDGAAKQANLCDLIHPAERLRAHAIKCSDEFRKASMDAAVSNERLETAVMFLREFQKWTTYDDPLCHYALAELKPRVGAFLARIVP